MLTIDFLAAGDLFAPIIYIYVKLSAVYRKGSHRVNQHLKPASISGTISLLAAAGVFFATLFFVRTPDAATIDLQLNEQDIKITGVNSSDYTGDAVVFGDINGDNLDDIMIAAPGFDYQGRSNCGLVYAIMAGGTLPGVIDLSSNAPYIKRIIGPASTSNVGAVLAAGDINGDSKDDIIWGMPWASPSGRFFAGEVIVVLGGASLPDTLDMALSPPGTAAFTGANVFDKLGSSLATGNIDNDLYDDILVGAPLSSPPTGASAGSLIVIYGSASPADIDMAGAQAGISRIFGARPADTFGNSCFAFDFNNDNYDDLLVGAPQATRMGRSTSGAAFIIYGGPSLPDTVDISVDLPGIKRFFGAAASALTGSAVCAGDVTGNGFPEAVISAVDYTPPGRSKAGGVYIIGGVSSLPDTIDMALSSPSISLFWGRDLNTHIGMSLAVGDFNSDSKKDIVIGSPQASPSARSGAGEVIIAFGRSLFAPVIDLALVQTGLTTILGASSGDYTGGSIAAGDMNNDGFNDLIVASRNATVSSNNNSGICSLIIGDPAVTPAQVAYYRAEASELGITIEFALRESIPPSEISISKKENGRTFRVIAADIIEGDPAHYSFFDTDVNPGREYTYKIFLGKSGTELFTVGASVQGFSPPALYANYPNPFSSSTTIPFYLPSAGKPRIRIYDVRGALVAELHTGFRKAGRQSVSWSGSGRPGETVPSGIYFVHMDFEGKRAQSKIVFLK